MPLALRSRVSISKPKLRCGGQMEPGASRFGSDARKSRESYPATWQGFEARVRLNILFAAFPPSGPGRTTRRASDAMAQPTSCMSMLRCSMPIADWGLPKGELS
jgi:hypothetical protein